MRKSTTISRPLALLLLMVMLASAGHWFELGMASASEVGPRECKDEIQRGISACMGVSMGQLPSPACCARVRVAHPECACPMVTPEVAARVDPKKAKKQIEDCGRPVPPHFKCGSLTFP